MPVVPPTSAVLVNTRVVMFLFHVHTVYTPYISRINVISAWNKFPLIGYTFYLITWISKNICIRNVTHAFTVVYYCMVFITSGAFIWSLTWFTPWITLYFKTYSHSVAFTPQYCFSRWPSDFSTAIKSLSLVSHHLLFVCVLRSPQGSHQG